MQKKSEKPMDKELMKQSFMDLADELERECGNWRELPDTEADKKLRERIIEEARKKG